MRRYSLTCFVTLAWATLLAVNSWAVEKRPNIILLLTDDQSYNSLGYAGNAQVKTPILDRLASEGLIFDAAYDTTSICMASRAQVMTGMYEYKTGCNFSHGPLRRDKWQQSYPVVLRKAGYFTGFVGKFGFAVKAKTAIPTITTTKTFRWIRLITGAVGRDKAATKRRKTNSSCSTRQSIRT